MKLTSLSFVLLAAVSAPASTVLVDNTLAATIASGDRANIRGFAFRPAAGGAGPAEVLTQEVGLLSLSLHRPGFNDATTPLLGSASGQITDASAPVYLKLYSSFTGGTAAGDLGTFLGASSNGISWSEVDAINGAGVSAATAAPFESYTYNLSSVALDKDTTYWAVFSETADSSADVANFRLIVEAGAGTAGTGYLADTVQVRDTSGVARDWGVYFTATVHTVPEPSGTLLGVLAGSYLVLRRRQR